MTILNLTNKYIKYTLRSLIGILVLLVLGLLFLRSPWGQNIIIERVVSYITEKTGTQMTIEKLFITFSGDVELQGLYLEDLQKDTLLYSRSLQADIALTSLVFDNTLQLDNLDWTGVVAQIKRSENTEIFNFTFLLETLLSEKSEPIDQDTEPFDIQIGTLVLTDIAVDYLDEFLGIESHNTIGHLNAAVNTINLKELYFYFDEVELTASELTYLQTKPTVPRKKESNRALPQLKFSDFLVKNVTANYHSVSDGMMTNVFLGELKMGIPNLDITSNTYAFDGLSLRNSGIKLNLTDNKKGVPNPLASKAEAPFNWPNLRLDGSNIILENNQFHLLTKGKDSLVKPFELKMSRIGLKTSTLSYEPDKAVINIDGFTFQEQSGFEIAELQFDGSITENHLQLCNLNIATAASRLNGAIDIDYTSLGQLINAPKKVFFDARVPSFSFSINDLFTFQPSLAANEIIRSASKYPVNGQLFAEGTLDAIFVDNSQLLWGNDSELDLEGTIFKATEIDSLSVDFKSILATSSKSDIAKLITLNDSVLSLPKDIRLRGKASGSIADLSADIELNSGLGNATFKGKGGLTQIPFVNGSITVDNLQLDQLLNRKEMGMLSFNSHTSLKGAELKKLSGDFEAKVSHLDFNGYTFSNLLANGTIQNGKGNIDLDYKDDNLNLTSKNLLNLDESGYTIASKTNLKSADLKALHITENAINLEANIQAEFEGSPNHYLFQTIISDGVSVLNDKRIQTNDILINGSSQPSTSVIAIKSSFLNGSLRADGNPDRIAKALRRQFRDYISKETIPNTQIDSIAVHLSARLTPQPIITELFLQGIEKLDTITINADFEALSEKIQVDVQLPYAEYQGGAVDSLHVWLEGSATNLRFASGFASLKYDQVHIKKTDFIGELRNKELMLDFASYDDAEKLMNIAANVTLSKDTINLSIDPSKLVFNKKQWRIPEDNAITISEKRLRFKNVTFAKNSQKLTISNAITGIDKEHLGVVFDNFDLQTFLSVLNPDMVLASGSIEGNFIVENPFGATGLVADFKINEFEVLQNSLGNLILKTESAGLSQYDFDLSLKDGGLDMNLTGDYAAAETGAQLNLDMDLNKLELKIIEVLSDGALTDSEGAISGNMKVTGTTENLKYDGTLAFNGTNFKVADLNAAFKISDETLKIDNSGLYLNDFQISDANDNHFTIDGTISTKTLNDPSFDLGFKTEGFQVINSTRDDNALFYGKATLDADFTVKGDLRLPVIEGKLKMRKITDITYVVSEYQLDVEEMEGVVIFIDREKTDEILSPNNQKETPSIFKGINANMILEIADEAIFNVIIDERSGDNLQLSGDAALNLNIEPNGRINLTGKYEVNSGHYETNLYNVVKRRFEINPGSTITFLGDPMDAKFDVTAVYSVKTSAAPLMSAVTSSQDASVNTKYRQEVPFLVYLNVDGELLEPKLSFKLDMPKDAQGSLGGEVYGRVLQLNEQEGELNKQVFSLLALNRFFPNSGSDGSIGGTTTLARDNVNNLLSGELNAFSNKILGKSGFQLDFDLDSFTDYQGDNPQDRTQLNINAKKTFLKDRLIVTAGSTVDVEGSSQLDQGENPIIGNFSLEYLLSEDGKYRLKGFQKNEYQNVIDGQITLTGIALIFDREFNRFSELFNPINKEKKKRKKAKKAKKKVHAKNAKNE